MLKPRVAFETTITVFQDKGNSSNSNNDSTMSLEDQQWLIQTLSDDNPYNSTMYENTGSLVNTSEASNSILSSSSSSSSRINISSKRKGQEPGRQNKRPKVFDSFDFSYTSSSNISYDNSNHENSEVNTVSDSVGTTFSSRSKLPNGHSATIEQFEGRFGEKINPGNSSLQPKCAMVSLLDLSQFGLLKHCGTNTRYSRINTGQYICISCIENFSHRLHDVTFAWDNRGQSTRTTHVCQNFFCSKKSPKGEKPPRFHIYKQHNKICGRCLSEKILNSYQSLSP